MTERRQTICVACGHLAVQRLTGDGKWYPMSCPRCTDGCSLYVREPSGVGGWRPGAFAGDASEQDPKRYDGLAGQGDMFRGM